MKSIFGILFLTLFMSTTAMAEEYPAANNGRTFDTNNGYGYEFDDDPLAAGGFGPHDSVIKVRPKAARVTLIRPRTSFVYEMFKSVEDI